METVREVTNGHDNEAALSRPSTSAAPAFVIVPTVEPPGGNYSHDSGTWLHGFWLHSP